MPTRSLLTGGNSRPEPSVRFWRPKGLLALPEAVRGGSIDDLRPLVNMGHEQFVLLVGLLLAYLRPTGPYPCGVIVGEQGTCKSTLAKLIRRLVDPAVCSLKGEPKDLKALMVTAINNWVVAYDNLSTIPAWQSDGFCRLATGWRDFRPPALHRWGGIHLRGTTACRLHKYRRYCHPGRFGLIGPASSNSTPWKKSYGCVTTSTGT